MLDDPIVQGDRDMSGFTFEVVAEGTETIGPTRLGTFTTDASGRTPAIDAGTAIYRISETGRPPWADGTIDPGPITVPFDPATAGAPVVEFSYTNRVPVATIDTEATDVADDDHVVELDGKADSTFTIVDRVSYCGLVPGTGYSLVGVLRPNAVDASAVDGTTTFVPDVPCGTESVTFDVRGDSGLRGQIAVVTETLTLASTGRVIARARRSPRCRPDDSLPADRHRRRHRTADHTASHAAGDHRHDRARHDDRGQHDEHDARRIGAADATDDGRRTASGQHAPAHRWR